MRKFLLIILFIILLPVPKETISKNNIILVNKKNPLTRNYVPTNLVIVPDIYTFRKTYLDKACLKSYIELYKAANYNYLIYSGYRSYEYQESIYNGDIYQAKPGESEHQTGLAIDVTIDGIGLTPYFSYTKEGIWLSENAYLYGFIIRYPQNKEKITGYLYEPWHIRYVGKYHARIIHKNNLTLEEYINTLKHKS